MVQRCMITFMDITYQMGGLPKLGGTTQTRGTPLVHGQTGWKVYIDLQSSSRHG